MRNRLLTFSALFVAGTVGGPILSGTALLPALVGGVTGVASNILAADLGTFLDKVANRFQGRDAVLQNDDLSKAVGRAIAAVIAKTTREGQFQDYREPLRRLASRATTDWAELLQSAEFEDEFGVDSLREPYLAQLFAIKPTEFAQVKALTPEIWLRILNTYQQQEPDFIRDPQVMSVVATCLHDQFPEALRSVLKEDFATGGRVFGAMALDLFGMLLGTLQEQNKLLERLTAGDSLTFEELAGWIESEFGNITQLLTELGIQLAEVETRILDHQDQGFQRIEAKLDDVAEGLGDLKRQTISVSLVIDTGRPLTSDWQGRQTELDTLGQQFERVGLIGITGLGGYGKSALANKLYETVDFPQKIWATMSQPYAFGDFGRWILGQLGFTLDEKADDKALAQFLIQQLMEQRCLVAIDNLETLLDENGVWQLPGYEAFFLRWLEYGRNSVILVTSRERPRLLGQNCFWQATLTGLTPTDGMLLLRSQGVEGSDADLQDFSRAADGHPLLLNLAAGLLIEQFGFDPDIADLQHLDVGLLEILGLHRGDPEASVKKLFAASFDRLEERLKRLLCNVSVYRLPFTVAAATVMAKETAPTWREAETQKQIEQDLLCLKRKSLLQEGQRNSDRERIFQFQPLIEQFLKLFIQDLDWAHNQAISFYIEKLKRLDTCQTDEDLKEYFEVFHHRCELKQYVQAEHILDFYFTFLDTRGYNLKLINQYERLTNEWNPISKEEELLLVRALERLGGAYFEIRDCFNSETLFQKTLNFYEENNISEGKANSKNSIGNIALLQNKYLHAIKTFQESLKIFHDLHNQNGKAIVIGNLGNAYYRLNQFPQALNCYRQSLRIKRLNRSDFYNLSGEAHSLDSIANIYREMGQLNMAIKFHQEALKISHDIPYLPGKARILGNLGMTYVCLEKYRQAVNCYFQSSKIYGMHKNKAGEKLVVENIENLLIHLHFLQINLESFDQCKKAIEICEIGVKLSKRIGNNAYQIFALNNLITIHEFLKNYQILAKIYEDILLFNELDLEYKANILNRLGFVCDRLNRSCDAVESYKQSLDIKLHIGDRHGFASSLDNLGNSYCALQQYQKAIECHQQASEIFKVSGELFAHAAAQFNLGNTLMLCNQFYEAISAYENARMFFQEHRYMDDVKNCNNALEHISKLLPPPKLGRLRKVWRCFMPLVRSILGR
jgi:tetratricopeptide (TPR) repeat protein